jgi:hypothetical protein
VEPLQEQVPLTQVSPDTQALPQSPQLLGSSLIALHEQEQFFSPFGQLTQVPFWHIVPPVQHTSPQQQSPGGQQLPVLQH